MWDILRDVWLPRLLFGATLTLALGLAALVVFAGYAIEPRGPFLDLFVHDDLVRRTALAAALGLAVTAFVFFKPTGLFRSKKPKTKPPGAIAGA